MAKQNTHKITKDGLVGECLTSALPAWERDGWTVVEDGSSGEEAATEQPQVREPDLFSQTPEGEEA